MSKGQSHISSAIVEWVVNVTVDFIKRELYDSQTPSVVYTLLISGRTGFHYLNVPSKCVGFAFRNSIR